MRDVMYKVGLYVLALFFIAGGINHFANPDFYLKMMPPYLPLHEWLNWVSGAAEAALGVLILPRATRRLAAWGLIALLVAVFPANVYMLQAHDTLFSEFPLWALIVRLPLQFILIYWAYIYARK